MAVSGPSSERALSLEWPTDVRTARERVAYGALALLLREVRRARGVTP